MRRRDFMFASASIVAVSAPLFARAQQAGKMYRIAIVAPATPPADISETGPIHYRATFGELRRLGYVEGENLLIDRFSAEGHAERYRAMVGEVVRRRPDAVLAIGSGILVELKAQTATIPIVGYSSDPIALGFARSLARPGGNITGVSIDGGLEIWAKILGLLKQAIPKLSRVGLLVVPTSEGQRVTAILKEAADKIGISIVGSPIEGPVGETAYRRAFADMVQARAEAIYVTAATSDFFAHRRLIVELVAKHGLPAIYPFEEFVDVGGLMAYAADLPEVWQHMADALAEILKGTKPGDVPFYQARKFNLVINLKTAKALGLEIPASLLARADEVIE